MEKSEFRDKVLKIYYDNDCTISEAIDMARKKFGISEPRFVEWFMKK